MSMEGYPKAAQATEAEEQPYFPTSPFWKEARR